MDMFKYNPDVKYDVGPHYHLKNIALNPLTIVVSDKSFQTKVNNPFQTYLNPAVKTDQIPRQWNSNPIQFYQNQLNFAIVCASTGCGVSYVNHLNHTDPLIKSVYRFHLYYQARRILSELSTPLPHEKSFKVFNNPIEMKAFDRICNEFNIDSTADFRQTQDKNHGLGSLYMFAVHNLYKDPYVPGITSFDHRSRVPLMSIEQHKSNAWTTFVLDTGKGFTQSGVERLNDSIRTYAWCILGSQAQTRTNIIGVGTSFDAQKQFLTNLEDAINSSVDLPSSIVRYQKTLMYARSKVDFVIGFGLYMIPSNMQLQTGTIMNYNNKIYIAGDEQSLGKNLSVNAVLNTVLKKEAPPESKLVPPPRPPPPKQDKYLSQPKQDHYLSSSPLSSTPPPKQDTLDHEDTKTAITIGLISLGLILLYFVK